MKHFIFYTPDGFTQAPDMSEVENFQILGFMEAPDIQTARDAFIMSHRHLLNMGFRNIECKEVRE